MTLKPHPIDWETIHFAVSLTKPIRQRGSDMVLVEGALEVGDRVVTEGVQTLRDGAAVTVVDTSDEGAATAAADRGRAI